MRGFLLNRLSQSLVLLVIVSIIGFVVLQPAAGRAAGAVRARSRHDPGRHRPDQGAAGARTGRCWIQYLGLGLAPCCRATGATPSATAQPVLAVIGRHLFATLLLMGTSTAHRDRRSAPGSASAAPPTAIRCSTIWRRSAPWSRCRSRPSGSGSSASTSSRCELGWLPAGNMYTIGDGSVLDYLHHLILPSIVLALVHVAIWSRYMRSATLDVINQDFVKTARAKGLTRARGS